TGQPDLRKVFFMGAASPDDSEGAAVSRPLRREPPARHPEPARVRRQGDGLLLRLHGRGRILRSRFGGARGRADRGAGADFVRGERSVHSHHGGDAAEDFVEPEYHLRRHGRWRALRFYRSSWRVPPQIARGGGEYERWSLRSEEHTSELQSLTNLVCRLLLEKNKKYR